MSSEIASLFVSINADLSGLDAALGSTRAQLQNLAGQGGLLGGLPVQTRQQVATLVAGVQEGLAPLPGLLKSGLEAPFVSTMNSLEAIVAGRMSAIIARINAAVQTIQALLNSVPGEGGTGGGGGTVEPRAEGGTVSKGRPYLVGERGPELFVPGGGGTIIPSHTLSAGRGPNIHGGTFNIYGVQDIDALYDQLRDAARKR